MRVINGVKTYYTEEKIPTGDEIAILSLDVALKEGETPDDGAVAVAGKHLGRVTYEIAISGNGWPEVNYTGPLTALKQIEIRYRMLGNVGTHKNHRNQKSE